MSVTTFSFADLVSKLIAEEGRRKDLTHIEGAPALIVGKGSGKKQHKNKHIRAGRKKAKTDPCSSVEKGVILQGSAPLT